MIKYILLTLITIFFSSCSSTVPPLDTRIESAFNYAKKYNLKDEIIYTENFDLFSLQNKNERCEKLNVYIEGDGLAFLNKNSISSNPTPINSTILKLMGVDKSSCKVYIARPCQYYSSAGCSNSYWTNKRFSPEIINSFNQAMDYLKVKYNNKDFILIGHSGGGAVASILASKRDDIDFLVTVAPNLDINKWVLLKNLTPLNGSLNPKDYTSKLENLKQYHILGKDDDIIPKEVFFSYFNSFENKSNIRYKIVDANHNCCYENEFEAINNLYKK